MSTVLNPIIAPGPAAAPFEPGPLAPTSPYAG